MTSAQKTKEIAKSLYIAGKSIEFIAEHLEKSVRTIQIYKANDAKAGISWDELRVVKYLGNSQKDSDSLYADFVTHMYDQLREIREDKNLTIKQRIEAISKLGDSFSKMRRIAAAENPEAYTHGIIKLTISKLISIITPVVDKQCLTVIVEQLQLHQDELADVSI